MPNMRERRKFICQVQFTMAVCLKKLMPFLLATITYKYIVKKVPVIEIVDSQTVMKHVKAY